ncbi:MAG: DUF373 family protein [Candidatus Thermoplasmatota archaeon]|jgi:putative membrane protein|nr:DUF373 family protein [Candidatus Thermoplasmatota archaeon]MCL6090177.1 DUF373 family protein [Candidatus Thermoplasmatota archaeon]MDA8143513.1 DUF373 family protein [Thermoplasmatales archaeon]
MTTLVLNVDRDNDYGEKAGIAGPIVGYEACYNAALKLISADPEDSDANALFGGIRHYADLMKQGIPAEIALITGDMDVGQVSDEIIGKQLDLLLSGNEFEDVILVTDGAEDDYIVPLIISRKKIRYVKHIIVRHNQNIESLYYYIVKALKDKKLINKFIIPLGIVLLTYGIVSLGFIIFAFLATKVPSIDPSLGALTFVTIILGAYFVERGFELWKTVRKFIKSVSEYAQETRILFLSYVISASLVFVGIASSYVITTQTMFNPVDGVLIFLSMFTWWVYGAYFAIEAGSAIEMYNNNNRNAIFRILYGLMFSLSVAFIVYGMINYIRYILQFIQFTAAIISLFFLVLGLIIAMLSSMVHRYFNEREEIMALATTSSPGNFYDNK